VFAVLGDPLLARQRSGPVGRSPPAVVVPVVPVATTKKVLEKSEQHVLHLRSDDPIGTDATSRSHVLYLQSYPLSYNREGALTFPQCGPLGSDLTATNRLRAVAQGNHLMLEINNVSLCAVQKVFTKFSPSAKVNRHWLH
jgi:hypothetical protein